MTSVLFIVFGCFVFLSVGTVSQFVKWGTASKLINSFKIDPLIEVEILCDSSVPI